MNVSEKLKRNELDWLSYGKIYQLLSSDSGTEIWMGQKFSRAFDHLCKSLFHNLVGRTRVPARACWERFLVHAGSE